MRRVGAWPAAAGDGPEGREIPQDLQRIAGHRRVGPTSVIQAETNVKHMTNQQQAPLLLKASHVAAWQLPELADKEPPPCRATLPALQRGAVWKPSQVEALWDSLLRGFPVGAFLLAPYMEDRGRRSFAHQDSAAAPPIPPDYHLLDGQQRCNGITVGFLNAWKIKTQGVTAALWVDLEFPEAQDERRFVFRVVTRSHPWGYRRNDPTQRLATAQRRTALSAYRKANESANSDQLPLSLVWPWDAKAPVPFSFLIEAVESGGNQVWEALRINLKNLLPFWQHAAELPCLHGEWKNRVQDLLSTPSLHMEGIAEGVRLVLGSSSKASAVRIPALILPPGVATEASEDKQAIEPKDVDDGTDTSERQDPLETLFIRVNSAGTPLVGEELMYSILKSIWPDAQRFVESLSTAFMTPSRLVMLLSRLILARTGTGRERPPASPDVGRFRRLIHGRDPQCPDFHNCIKDSLMKGEAKALFNTARELLMGTPENVHHRLPPVLPTELAHRSPEAFFLLLVWLDRMKQVGCDPIRLDTQEQQRLLGAITALGWFAYKPTECLTTLWGRLQKLEPQSLPTFFSQGALKPCLQLSDRREMQLIPLLPPDILQSAVEESVTQAYGYRTPTSQFWSTWEWWDRFSGTFTYKKTAEDWYSRRLRSWKRAEDDDGQELRLHAWTQLAKALWSKRELVLYAQREFLMYCFPHYDPSSLDQLEDTDRPWDMDHIHPQKYIYGRWNIPRIIKDWHGSIGNLRAWPMEVNRADGEDPPCKKLLEPGDTGGRYGLTTGEQLRNASFVGSEWSQWQASTPDKDGFPANYLARPEDYPSCRGALITAITSRWVALYREWYETLLIGDLFR